MRKLGLFLIALAFGGLVLFYWQFSGPSGAKEKQRFIIKRDASQAEIVDQLVEEKFLRNKIIFNWLKAWRRQQISPGAYLVAPNMNAYQLLKVLTSTPYQKWVTLPSASRKEQVALALKRALGWPEEKMLEFIKIAKEGWLYPDTYLINTDYTAQQTFQKLFNTFNEKLGSDLPAALLAKNIRLDTAIKIASLIEREAGGETDKNIIAAVIWNRLEKKIRLEIDATIQYALTSQKIEAFAYKIPADFDFWSTVTGPQIRQTQSPYNTYLNDGLPPGPISTPSISSIWAVAEPAPTNALFYLHSPDGQIHTARTYQEHLQNIRQYLDITP